MESRFPPGTSLNQVIEQYGEDYELYSIEVHQITGRPMRSIIEDRVQGRGIPFIKRSEKINAPAFYRAGTVRDAITAQEFTSIAEVAARTRKAGYR